MLSLERLKMQKIVSILFRLFILTNFLEAKDFTLKSSDLKNWLSYEQVYDKCGGKNISPSLKWENPPKNTKSFAITMYDPDAPTSHGWWHWIVINIPADINQIAKNASSSKNLPKGAIELKNDYGFVGYGGACPPKGKPHRYITTIYALDTKISNNISIEKVINKIKKHTIDKSSIMSLYKR